MASTVERTLALKLVGDVSGLRKDLKPATRQFGQLTKSAVSWGKALSGALVIGGIERVVGGLGDAFKGFKSGQRVAAQLRKTWRNLGLEGKAYGRTLDRITASTLKLGTSDDEAVAAFTRSIQRTKDYDRSLKELGIAQDLVANGSAPNLDAAMRIIQQAAKGSARVVDRFGLDSKTAAGRVNELGRQVRGAAREKARLDPFGVLFNRLAEDAETIVGAFAQGNFKGVVKGLQGLGETIADALFGPKGSDNIRNSKKAGLVNQFGGWASTIAKSIQDEFGKVDWAKTISDTFNKALETLTKAGENGTLSTLGTIGAAIAAGIFAVDTFLTAASALFKAPGWLIKAGARKGLGAAVAIASVAVGKAFAAGMFVAQMFTSIATDMFKGITKIPAGLKVAVTAFGRLIGSPLGQGILLGVAAAFTANALLDLLATKLDETFQTNNFTAARREQTAHGVNPLDMFARVLEGLLPGHESGLAYVPRDNYPAMLHKGERVLTAEENRRGTGSTVHVSITVNAPVASDGYRVGQQIAAYLDQWASRGGRFRHLPTGAR